jgi:hypothetical protein
MGSGTGQKGSNASVKEYSVDYSESFLQYYYAAGQIGLTHQLDCIDDFVDHFFEHGLNGWRGKVAPSTRLPENYPDREVVIAYAEKHQLWHAHIGDPNFKPSKNGQYEVSDGVLHFQRNSPYSIKIVSISYHNPMELPKEDEL